MNFDLSKPESLRSYIMTMQTMFIRLASMRECFDDDKWLMMASNMLRCWFTYETEHVEYNQSLIKLLTERNLLPADFKDYFK
ncbi:phage DNA packaging protein C [Lelliottia sp. SL45]|uniref:phage DNA packaging protein C n=1 Tax=Lelliottia sp. SL45 TaxID=2994665 RepID=UPI0022737D94|nr:phage DNA packaging protein C [Lelliottia sp. SL45]MCY1699062.1 phage DNA packaging protein C [Lelliottia sp. SL45]